MKILTEFVCPPNHHNCDGWVAWVEGDDDGPYGAGDTEQTAIEDLIHILEAAA